MTAVLKGFISFSYTEELRTIYGDVMTPKLKKADGFASESFLHIESCVMLLLKALIQASISFSYTEKLGTTYGDVMTKKHKNVMI